MPALFTPHTNLSLATNIVVRERARQEVHNRPHSPSPTAKATRMTAETFYYFLFGSIAAVCSLIEYGNYKHASSGGEKVKEVSATFLSFRNNYLAVYALMMAGDWLQGVP